MAALTGSLAVTFALGIASLYALVRAAGVAVDRSVALARHYEVPDVVVGSVVVALGTSLPEIGSHVVSSVGILAGTLDYEVASATVLGGNMGSSTLQQFLLVGLFLVGHGRYELRRTFVRTSYVPMLLALGLAFLVALGGVVTRVEGVVLLGAFLAYLYSTLGRRRREVDLPGEPSENVRRDVLVAVLALAVVFAAAFGVLVAIEAVVDRLRLGGSMIGVVTIGLASALPELSTVVEAMRRDAANVALGTLVGSNTVNVLVGIGLGGAISTYAVPPAVVAWDLPAKLAVGVGLLVWVTRRRTRRGVLGRHEGALLVVAYFAYLSVRLLLFAGQ